MGGCSVEVAARVVEGIEADGSIARLAIPVELLDPAALWFWVKSILGDWELAELLGGTPDSEVGGVLAERREQCERMMHDSRSGLRTAG